MQKRKQMSIAERQRRLDRRIAVLQYVTPIIVASIAATIFSSMLC